MPGFVTFVSSGPGAADLLTLRAANRLRQADVVLYDDLSSGPILEMIRPEAEAIAVGKRAGRPSARQEEVNRLLCHHARRGLRVVRLKSGDAGVFGRLEEEIIALSAQGIGFEIVPGVTAATSATAAAGLPLTRRLTARRVQFITGADTRGQLPGDLNWAALADPMAVTVIYMGQRTFPDLAARLIQAGMDAATPALLAHGISTPDETIARHSIASLAAHLRNADTSQPGLILYGPLAF
ncbi:uroporphyrinogen-III C-methyltransferase [Gemmobacter serpentinus]|uniref:uroporphyrinogen-III C-methyltransferase n=1 Tax=Gemmobacter serpentinus TaxID=2652247 RepID=UPI00124DBCF1|nr:uroporphyrinogen-III C-methyltransferase [Gemmobacter serpentinus]